MRYYNVELLDSLPFPPFPYEEKQGRLHLTVPDDLLHPLLVHMYRKEDGELANLYFHPVENKVIALVLVPRHGAMIVESALEGQGYQSLTVDIPAANLYEREMLEMSGVMPLD
ncbi:MAG: hypothetical protein MIO90_02710, partial [Methanomassiliicoccales archaeon]|nr:hypothetical protein [Methanomassiliicoccales archaeon]